MSEHDREENRTNPIFERPIDRRAFLGLSAAGGAALLLAACGGGDGSGAAGGTTAGGAAATGAGDTGAAAGGSTVAGGTPAERAIAAIKALNLPPDTTLTVFSEDLSILAAEVTKAAFEEQSGIRLNIQKAPFLEYAARVFNDATTQAGEFDVVLMETNRMGDLDNAGYLVDLTAWVEAYNPDLGDMIPPQSQVWPQYNGKFVGLPTDGDVFMFYYRKDLLEDPAEQQAFESQYGRPLEVPVSYDDYRQVVEFFTRPDDNLYGAVEWRVRGATYWWFWQRLWSNGGTYFNDDMSAAINTPAGVQALEDMKDLNQFMPPDVLSYGYVETVAAMQNGTAFSNITWPAAGKNVSDPESSQTAGMWGYAAVPGYLIDGVPNPRSMSAPGYNAIVSEHSKQNKEAAYLYAQWLVSPENLIVANQNPAGNTDVIRTSIFDNPEMGTIFDGAEEYLQAQKANLAQAVPDPIMPGYTEYTQALEIEISDFMTTGKTAQEALDAAAARWDQITDGFGREQQQQIWQNFLSAYQVS